MHGVHTAQIAVLAAGIALDDLHARLSRVLSVWPSPTHPAFQTHALSRVWAPVALHDAVAKADVILLFCDADHLQAARTRLLRQIDDAPVPLVVIAPTRPGHPTRMPAPAGDTDVFDLPESIDDHALAGLLLGLVRMAPTDRALRARCHMLETAGQAAVQQLDRLHDEMHVAAQLQRQLLPAVLPDRPGLRLATLCNPGSTLSGDMFDVISLDEHHLGLFIADAVGHGVAAALTLALLSRLLPTHDGIAPTLNPGATLARMNNAFMHRRGEAHALVTAAYAILDTRTWTLSCALAGHPAPVVIGPHGRRELSAGGPPLGTLEDADFPTARVNLDPGDVLALYTDGFEHAFDDRDHHSAALPAHQRFLSHFDRAAEHCQDHGPKAAIQQLVHRLAQQRGSLHQLDDITLLLLHRENDAGALRLRAAA